MIENMLLICGNNCAPCEYLKQWLKDNNVEIKTIIAQENIEYIKSLGIRTVPTLLIDNKTIINNLEPIKEYIQQNVL